MALERQQPGLAGGVPVGDHLALQVDLRVVAGEVDVHKHIIHLVRGHSAQVDAVGGAGLAAAELREGCGHLHRIHRGGFRRVPRQQAGGDSGLIRQRQQAAIHRQNAGGAEGQPVPGAPGAAGLLGGEQDHLGRVAVKAQHGGLALLGVEHGHAAQAAQELGVGGQ